MHPQIQYVARMAFLYPKKSGKNTLLKGHGPSLHSFFSSKVFEKRHSVAMRGHGFHRYQLLPVIEIRAGDRACAVRGTVEASNLVKASMQNHDLGSTKSGVFSRALQPQKNQQEIEASTLNGVGVHFLFTEGAQQPREDVVVWGLFFFGTNLRVLEG